MLALNISPQLSTDNIKGKITTTDGKPAAMVTVALKSTKKNVLSGDDGRLWKCYTNYNADYFHYDQYTGKSLKTVGSWDSKFKDAKLADKIARMNYDIHVGAVLGLPGKILAFFASLIAASLPVTGFVIWWGRRKKSKAKPVDKEIAEKMSLSTL